MASENETVAEIVKEMRQVGPYAIYRKPIFADAAAVSLPYAQRFMYGNFVTDFGTIYYEKPKVKEVSNYELTDRIEAAHRREMEHRAIIAGASLADGEAAQLRAENAELRECLNEAIELTCDNCDLQSDDGKCTAGVCPWVTRWRKALKGAKHERGNRNG